ncbi:hypothetical protein JHK87_051665 [Glycine soja]|nr:hypothetical protein JHK87_051665 [Glycine soja]
MAGALETQCGQSFGTEQFHKLGNYVFCAILFLILSSAPISILWIFMDKLLVLLGQDHAISLVAGNYCIWLIPALWLCCSSSFGSLFSDSELDLSNAWAGRPQAAREAVFAVIVLTFTDAIVFSSVLFCFRHVLGFAFSNEMEVVHSVAKIVPAREGREKDDDRRLESTKE